MLHCPPPLGSYLVGDDCPVLVHSRVKLPTAELTSPSTGDRAAPNAAQGATYRDNQDDQWHVGKGKQAPFLPS